MRVKDLIKYFIIMIYTKKKQKNFLLILKAESPTLSTKRRYKYGQDLLLNASPATGLTWQFVDADGNPVEKKDGDTDTYYSTPAAGTYYIVIYSATKQTGVTVSASLC